MSDYIYKRLKRFDIPDHAHELTFSCFKRQKLLNPDWTKQILAESIMKAKEKHGFFIWAYVFMANHVHLLIKPENDDYSIADICRTIKHSSSRRIVYIMKERYPAKLHLLETGQKEPKRRFWMPGGGYDRNIYRWKSLRAAVNYIHNNPVRAGLVEKPEDWKWSSAGDWLCDRVGPLPVDKDSVG